MGFHVGDYVRFLNERQEGFVTRIISSDIIGVTIDGDFEIPVAAKEIVLVAKEEIRPENDEKNYIVEFSEKTITSTKGIYFAFIPDSKVKNLLQIQLINNTGYEVLYSFSTLRNKQFEGHASGKASAKSFNNLINISQSDFNDWPAFHFQLIQHLNGEFYPSQPIVRELKIKAKNFASSFGNLPLIKGEGYCFQLDDEIQTYSAENIENAFFKPNQKSATLFIPPAEVDLHAESFIENWNLLDGGEILKQQLQYFQQCMDAALVHNFKSIVFIHGVGNGILRHEIQKKLSKNGLIKTFKDARKEKFGYGATEVVLK